MLKLSVLAAAAAGQLQGEDIAISGIRGLDEAGAGDITFLANPAYQDKLFTTKASAVILTTYCEACKLPQIVVADAYLAMAAVAAELSKAAVPKWGIHPSAIVAKEAQIAADSYIGPGCVIEAAAVIGSGVILDAQVYIGPKAVIGAESHLYPGVKVLKECIVGRRNILYAGAVIGSDGFGYAPDKEGRRHKIPQIGIVELEDDVEVGANATIDRSTFGVTKIGHGTKIDNLVMVAHNVQIGHDTVLCSQVGIAGSTTIGDRVIAAGQSGINGHIKIGNDCVIAGQSGVAKDLPDGSRVAGAPAIPHVHWLKNSLLFARLDELFQRLSKVEKQLENNK